MKLVLKSKTGEEKEIDINGPLIACHFKRFEGYLFPEETRDILDESIHWAWDNGWRGYVRI